MVHQQRIEIISGCMETNLNTNIHPDISAGPIKTKIIIYVVQLLMNAHSTE